MKAATVKNMVLDDYVYNLFSRDVLLSAYYKIRRRYLASEYKFCSCLKLDDLNLPKIILRLNRADMNSK